MPVTEHLGEREFGGPGNWRQFKLNVVGQLGLATNRYKFVAMHPAFEEAFYLLIDEQAVLFICGMQRYPPRKSDSQNDAGAHMNAAALIKDADGRKGGR